MMQSKAHPTRFQIVGGERHLRELTERSGSGNGEWSLRGPKNNTQTKETFYVETRRQLVSQRKEGEKKKKGGGGNTKEQTVSR